MLKIESSTTLDGRPILRAEGRVIGPWVGELHDACDRALAVAAGLTLDLSQVVFVDRSGLELLCALGRRGVNIDCSPFVAEQLKARRCQ